MLEIILTVKKEENKIRFIFKIFTNVFHDKGGSIPDYSVAKCSEYTETTPMARNIDLLSVFKVKDKTMYFFISRPKLLIC